MSRVQTSARRGGMSGRPSCSRSTGIRSGRGGTGRPRSQIALPPRRSPGRAGRVDVLGRAAPDKGVAEASEPAAAPPACTGRRQECASRAGAKRRSEPLAAGGPAGPVGAPSWRRRGEDGRTPTSEPESLSGAILFVARARRRRGSNRSLPITGGSGSGNPSRWGQVPVLVCDRRDGGRARRDGTTTSRGNARIGPTNGELHRQLTRHPRRSAKELTEPTAYPCTTPAAGIAGPPASRRCRLA
jgi:hypothetical protein